MPLPLAALVLSALATAPAARPARPSLAPSSPDASPWTVRLLGGRAVLARGGEVLELGAGRDEAGGRGAATLVVGPGSRVELAWRSLASLRIEGPAELEWGSAEGGELVLELGAVARLELEARRLPVRLELTQGWSLGVAEAAVQLSGEPTGGWGLRHHGGREVRVRSRVPREERDWPRVVRSGERARLGPARRDGGSRAGRPGVRPPARLP